MLRNNFVIEVDLEVTQKVILLLLLGAIQITGDTFLTYFRILDPLSQSILIRIQL